MGRAERFFFLHLGNLVVIFHYFGYLEAAAGAPDRVLRALLSSLVMQTIYVAVASWRGARKLFDVALLLLFGGGTLGLVLGSEAVLRLYTRYSPALLFGMFLSAALFSLRPGGEPFTTHFARAITPGWQQRTVQFVAVNRFMTAYWASLFGIATALCLLRPFDPLFTVVYPNLLIVGAGVVLGRWVPDWYLRRRTFPLPDDPEALVMGLPLMFDPQAAAGAHATIQFHLSGASAGDYHVCIADGRCESFAGVAPSPDLTIRAPGETWRRIAHGELDGGEALLRGWMLAEGNLEPLTKLGSWFTTR